MLLLPAVLEPASWNTSKNLPQISDTASASTELESEQFFSKIYHSDLEYKKSAMKLFGSEMTPRHP